MSDAELAHKLTEIFSRLALHRTFFTHTDHLSDRELYDELTPDTLNEEFPDMQAVSPTGAYIIDMLGGCSEEDMLTYNRYYATPDERKQWLEDYPDDEMPPHEQLPFDRDRSLPPPPQGW